MSNEILALETNNLKMVNLTCMLSLKSSLAEAVSFTEEFTL